VRYTDVNEDYDPAEEVEKYVWADVVIYHTPIWWFQVPHGLKKYIDVVFTEGHAKGIYHSDGRSSANPAINYGTGGMLHGRQYMVTSSWNAPKEAFTLPNEFFNETSVDDGDTIRLSPHECIYRHDAFRKPAFSRCRKKCRHTARFRNLYRPSY
jgi:modulator of drug activity B